MDKLYYLIINLAYIFTKFFISVFWIYLTCLIFLGGEIKITLGKNGMRMGYEGLIPFVRSFFK